MRSVQAMGYAKDDIVISDRGRILEVYARLPVHSPYVGTFHYAPGAGNRARSIFFQDALMSLDEFERRRQIRLHPLTGTFHFAPGKFSTLHGLQNFREEPQSLAQAKKSLYLSQGTPAPPEPHHISWDMSGRTSMEADIDVRHGLVPDRSLPLQAKATSGKLPRAVSMGVFPVDLDALESMNTASYSSSDNKPFVRTVPGVSNEAVNAYLSARWKGMPTDGEAKIYRPISAVPSPPSELSDGPFSITSPDLLSQVSGSSGSSLENPSVLAQGPKGSWQVHTRSAESVALGNEPRKQVDVFAKAIREAQLPETPDTRCRSPDSRPRQPSAQDTQRLLQYMHSRLVVVDENTVASVYEIHASFNIGQGSYAVVVPATHRCTGIPVAMKIIKKSALATEEEQSSIRREIENHVRLRHTNIVTLFEALETPEHIYVVLERCQCGDLENMLQLRRKLTELETKFVTRQLLSGVAHMHAQGILHSDMKPSNVLFTLDSEVFDLMHQKKMRDGTMTVTLRSPSTEAAVEVDLADTEQPEDEALQNLKNVRYKSPVGLVVKICDLGLSRRVPDVRYYKHSGDINKVPFTEMTGTEAYMSPEMLSRQAFGKATDMWAVGVIMYRCLVGSAPFVPIRKCTEKEISLTGVLWNKISPEARDLLSKLMRKSDTERITAERALSHPWFDAVEHYLFDLHEATTNRVLTVNTDPSPSIPPSLPVTTPTKPSHHQHVSADVSRAMEVVGDNRPHELLSSSPGKTPLIVHKRKTAGLGKEFIPPAQIQRRSQSADAIAYPVGFPEEVST